LCVQTILLPIGSPGQPVGPHVRRSRRRAGPGARSAQREHAGRVATFNGQGTQSNANDGVDRIGGQNALDPAIELRFARARDAKLSDLAQFAEPEREQFA